MKKLITFLLMLMVITFGIMNGSHAENRIETEKAIPSMQPGPTEKPLEIALWSPLQIQTPETKIHGLRLNILYGVNPEVYGADMGLVNQVNGSRCF